MAPGQHDAAMIDLGHTSAGLLDCREAGTLNQRSAACGAPVPCCLVPEQSVALAADAFHVSKISG